jgi:hypothetical protein
MAVRPILAAYVLVALLAAPSVAAAQSGRAALPERAIHRDIPLTNMIRRAHAAGTRDSTGRPGRDYWQLRVDYTIQARLDAPTGIVTGRETAVISNTSPTPLTSIQLRLDQNVFAANVVRDRPMPEITSGMAVQRITVNGQAVDLNPPTPQFRRGGGPAPETRLAAYGLGTTSARLTLPTPVAPRSTATLEVEWTFQVPRADGQRGLRMGRWADSLYQVAQWYPRVAVYDDLRDGGWDTEPYLGSSEFYNNFGRFDVTIDVPAGWVVGASGVLQNPAQVLTAAARERLARALTADTTLTVVGAAERGPGRATASGDRLQWRFVADTVADFAWATSSQYVWEVTRATIPTVGAIPVHILYLPGHAQAYTQAGPVVRHALEFYSQLWMPYAFPQLTIVEGPDGGMEYPAIIFSSVGAADHETGHEWWPMMVGNNETWYGWMDEGLNSYMGTLSRAHRMGQQPNLDGPGQMYGRISGDEREAPLAWNANYGGPMYQFQAYQKAGMMLSMLGGIVGDTAVWRAMSGWAQAWRFKHPSPWDFAFYLSHALQQDLGWFWHYWLFTTEAVNGGIEQVTSRGSRTTVTVRQDGQMPSPVVLQVRFAPTGPAIRPMRNAVMKDSVTAVVTWPVDVWFTGQRRFDAVLDFGGRRIERVLLDPRCRFPDRDLSDNVWPRDSALTSAAPGGGGAGFGQNRCYGS